MYVNRHCLIFNFAGVQAQSIDEYPENTAAAYGDRAELTCRVNNVAENDFVEWSFSLNGTAPPEIIYISGDGDTTRLPGYEVPPQSERDQGILDLTIQNSQTDMAGEYLCRIFRADIRGYAHFVPVSK